jgi:hypothetical protein
MARQCESEPAQDTTAPALGQEASAFDARSLGERIAGAVLHNQLLAREVLHFPVMRIWPKLRDVFAKSPLLPGLDKMSPKQLAELQSYRDDSAFWAEAERLWRDWLGCAIPFDEASWRTLAYRLGLGLPDAIDKDWLHKHLVPALYAKQAGDIPPLASGHGTKPTRPADPPGLSRREAAERLERLRLQGERWTSYGTMGQRIGCSAATVFKAVKERDELRRWATHPAAAPRAQSLNAVLIDSTAQTVHPNPADEAAIREYLEREDLTAEERAFFQDQSREVQLELLDREAEQVVTRGGKEYLQRWNRTV